MGNTIVIYRSKTGYTKKYVDWLVKELKCDVMENNKLTLEQLSSYSTIILGGSVFAGKIRGAEIFKKYPALLQRRVIVFACGISVPSKEELRKMWEFNFTQEQLERVHCYYCRGGLNLSKMNWFSRFMMKKIIKKKAVEEQGQTGENPLEALKHPVDYTDITYMKPMIDELSE